MHDENGMSETRVEACFVLVIYNYLMLSVHPRSQFTYMPHSQQKQQLILEVQSVYMHDNYYYCRAAQRKCVRDLRFSCGTSGINYEHTHTRRTTK